MAPAFNPVATGTAPGGLAYDYLRGTLYASAPNWNSVLAINLTSRSVVANVSVGLRPGALTYDSAEGLVFVANNGSNTLSVVNTSSGNVTATVPVGTNPTGVWYYPGNDSIYVANYGSSNITVLRGQGLRSTASIPVLSHPFQISDGLVTQPTHNDVTVLDLSQNVVSATRTTGPEPTAVSGSYITDSGGSTVSIYNGVGTTPAPVGKRPIGVAWDRVTARAFVANAGSRNITILDGSATAASFPLSFAPGPMAVDPVTGSVFVGGATAGWILALPASVDTVVATLHLPPGTSGLAFDRDDGTLAALNSARSIVSFVNATGWMVGPVVGLAGGPSSVMYDGSHHWFLLTLAATGRLLVLDPRSGQTLASIRVGALPSSVAVDPTSGLAYVGNRGSSTISVVNLTTKSMVQSIHVGAAPRAIAYLPGAGVVLVANSGSGTVSVVDPRTATVSRTLAVGSSPAAIVIDSAAGWAFVANEKSGNVTKLTSTGVVSSIPAGSRPSALAFNPGTDQVYVANNGSGNVTVFSATNGIATASVATGAVNALAWDGSDGLLFAAGYASNLLKMVDTARSAFISGSTVSAGLQGAAYLPGPNQLLTNFGDSFDALNASTGAVLQALPSFPRSSTSRFPSGAATAVAVDPITSTAYATFFLGGLEIINGSSNRVRAFAPIASLSLQYDPLTGYLYSAGGTRLYVLNASTGSIAKSLVLSGSILSINPVTGDVYLCGQSSTIYVIQGSTNSLVQTFTAPAAPIAALAEPGGGFLFLLFSGGSVSRMDLTNGSIASTSSIPKGSTSLAYDPISDTVLTASPKAGSLTVLNRSSGALIRTIRSSDPISSLIYASGPRAVLALSPTNGSIEWLNASTLLPFQRSVVPVGLRSVHDHAYLETNAGLLAGNVGFIAGSKSSPLPMFPDAVDFAPGGITQGSFDNVTVVNGPYSCRARACPLEVAVGRAPGAIVAVPPNGNLWIANSGSDNLSVVHLNNLKTRVIGTVPVGHAPGALIYDSANGLLYVANTGGANVTVVNVTTHAVVGSITVGVGPRAMTLDPRTGRLYVANSGASTVSVIDTSSNSVAQTLSVGASPDSIAVDSALGLVLVDCQGPGSIWVVRHGMVATTVFRGVGPATLLFDPSDPAHLGIALLDSGIFRGLVLGA